MRRIYRRAEPLPTGAGHGVALDGRLVKTPDKNELVVPSAALAAAIAAEWDAQEAEIRPAEMPLTRLASTAIDRIGPRRAEIVHQIADYGGTDLVCYRAAHPPALTLRQQEAWQPLIDWAVLRYDAPLAVTAGVVPTGQPEASLRALAAAVAEHGDFALAALHAETTACGSLVIALALSEGRLDAAEAFTISQLDESHQIEAWGEDAEQARRRALLAEEIEAAARFLSLLRSG